MGCRKYRRIRAKDVGRRGHHYVKLGVRRRAGRRGGYTERIGGLRKYKHNPHKRKKKSRAGLFTGPEAVLKRMGF